MANLMSSLTHKYGVGRKAKDTQNSDVGCTVFSEHQDHAIVVYDDEPHCPVSTGNHQGRFKG